MKMKSVLLLVVFIACAHAATFTFMPEFVTTGPLMVEGVALTGEPIDWNVTRSLPVPGDGLMTRSSTGRFAVAFGESVYLLSLQNKTTHMTATYRAQETALSSISFVPDTIRLVALGLKSVGENEFSMSWHSSKDGGLTWSVQNSIYTYVLVGPFTSALHFAGRHGLAASGPAVFATTDGGETWAHTLQLDKGAFVSVAAVYNESVAVVMSGDTAYASLDGFRTWTPIGPIDGGGFSGVPQAFHFIADSTWLLATDDPAYVIWRTDDAGLTWSVAFDAHNVSSVPPAWKGFVFVPAEGPHSNDAIVAVAGLPAPEGSIALSWGKTGANWTLSISGKGLPPIGSVLVGDLHEVTLPPSPSPSSGDGAGEWSARKEVVIGAAIGIGLGGMLAGALLVLAISFAILNNRLRQAESYHPINSA